MLNLLFIVLVSVKDVGSGGEERSRNYVVVGIAENTLSFLPLSLSAARSRSCAAAMRKHPELDNEAAELSGTGNTSESIN